MSRRLSVAMVAACPYPSAQGTQALIGELARGLSARGHRVHLVCYGHGAFECSEPFTIHRCRNLPGYRRMRSGPDPVRPWLDALLAWRAQEVIRSQSCQLVHAHNYEGALAGWLAARACRVRLVYHAHNLMADELPRYFGSKTAARAARVVGWALDRSVPRLADRVIALHEKLAAELLAQGVAPGRLEVVEPGIDVDFWRAEQRRRAGDHTVAYCGNLDAYQNLELLVSAMTRVVEQLPTAKLLLATPNEPTDARDLVGAHRAGGFVELVHTADAKATRAVLQRSALAICPRSSSSGFPIKNLNAAAAGLPVIACRGSAFGLLPGRTGLQVPDDDAQALATAIVELLRDPERRFTLGEAGQQLARERFGRERQVAQVERVWSASVDGRRGERVEDVAL